MKTIGMSGRQHSTETRQKISASLKGHPVSQETRHKLAIAQRGRCLTEETKRKMSLSQKGKQKGKIVSEETKQKISEAKKGKHLHISPRRKAQLVAQATQMGLNNAGKSRNLTPEQRAHLADLVRSRPGNNIGKHWSLEVRKKIGDSQRGRHNTPEHIAKCSASLKGRNAWSKGLSAQTDSRLARMGEEISRSWNKLPDKVKQERLRRTLLGGKRHPNELEKKFRGILDNIFLNEYRYCGDFSVVIGGRCPDFINVNGKKKLIEVFGDYWHKNENPVPRVNHYKKYGFECLVVWENEIHDASLVSLTQKLGEYHNK